MNKTIDGNTAVAEAMRQINPPVVAGFPITPTSSIMEKFSVFVAKNQVNTNLILAESEHAAMSACVGVSAGGGRTMTATSSQGLILMEEVLYNASGMRLPIVLINGNRALSAPLSIHGDHSDIMAVRDTGWIILMAQDAQEAYDFTLQAFRIAENLDVRTPVIVAMDGFATTHTKQKVKLEDDEKVQKFLGEVVQVNPLLDVKNPVSYGAATKPDYYTECKRGQLDGMINAQKIIPQIGAEFTKKFGRDYTENTESFYLDDAEFVFVIMGSLMGTVKEGVEALRKKGIKAGALRIRTFRPFPSEEIAKKLAKAKKIAILERTSPSGATGSPLYNEIRSAMFDIDCKISPFIVGLGGRELYPENIAEIYEAMQEGKEIDAHEGVWVGLR